MPSTTAYPILGGLPPYWGWTTYTPVIPKLYWDVYSQEERIKRLCMEYDKLTHYASAITEEVNEVVANVEQTLADFTAMMNAQIEEQNAHVESELAAMRYYIDQKFAEFAEGSQVYDVTTGEYRPSMQSMRRLLQAITWNFKEENQLVSYYAQNKTVGELAQQSCYNVAYSDLDTITIDDQRGAVVMLEGN